MDDLDDLLLTTVFLILVKLYTQSKRGRYWVHPLNENRDTTGLWNIRMIHLRRYPKKFFQYFRMTPTNFDYILDLIRPDIEKEDTNMRLAIKPDLRLAITLHHLAEGSSHAAIAEHYSLGKSTVSIAFIKMNI